MDLLSKNVVGSATKIWARVLIVLSVLLTFNLCFLSLSGVLGLGAAVAADKDGPQESRQDNTKEIGTVTAIEKGKDEFVISFSSGMKSHLNIMNSKVFRYHLDPTGAFPDYPKPNKDDHVAKIVAKSMEDYGNDWFGKTSVKDDGDKYVIENTSLRITFVKNPALMSVHDKSTNTTVMQEISPVSFSGSKATQTLKQESDEQYFGGGTQNGHFAHKGKNIQIVNTNQWTDGGVASPNPFFWSTRGYGVVRNTWQPGNYNFGTEDHDKVITAHSDGDFDAFYFIEPSPVEILKDYYELTGKPVLMPEYAFYQAHLSAYNRDTWVEESEGAKGAVKFEDGKYYRPYEPDKLGDKKGTLESLNGEKDNYQFSARKEIDRYVDHDMPLGWFLPNDGYGAGYGQTDSLDGDIENLKQFAGYANKHGVEVGLWTQSNLHPKDPAHPKKGERDINKEVSDAGVKALKTDVAWVGDGYSFGLNGVEDAANVFEEVSKGKVRPMIVSLDGWAGTQRHASIWTGDQKGGEWEYIRFHIPTYIGTGLSGQPNVGSDMDAIFGGGNKEVNIRDYQWKAFTPIQLNMDKWGTTPKKPFAFDKEATDINRAYLKLKSMMMPYTYTIAHEAVDGKPMVRALGLEYPNDPAGYSEISKYQYMWGPDVLIAPIYNDEKSPNGESVRDVYLPDPEQVWVDLFTGKKYQGGRSLHGVEAPLWKIPVFVKDGAIIPMVNPNNNPAEIDQSNRSFLLYPNGESSFDLYEDDGISTDYKNGKSAITQITSSGPKSNQSGELAVTVKPTTGGYSGFVADKTTRFDIMSSQAPEGITATVAGQDVKLTKATSSEEFAKGDNMYYFDPHFQVDQYLSDAAGVKLDQSVLSIKIAKHNVSETEIAVKVKGFVNNASVTGGATDRDPNLAAPANVHFDDAKTTPTALAVQWDKVKDAVSYDVERDGHIMSGIKDNQLLSAGLAPQQEYTFKVRAVSDTGVSDWSGAAVGKTSEDPYANVIKGVRTTSNIPAHKGHELDKLTDANPHTVWHTQWSTGTADPSNGKYLTLDFDLGKVYKIDKVEYLPREDAGTGTITEFTYQTSPDGIVWTDSSKPVTWAVDGSKKTIDSEGQEYRFLRMKVLSSVDNYGSGSEMMFYKVPGSEGFLPGDITNQGQIDSNTATSYRNYMGLERVDADFSYIEKGDLNNNGVIDAYDVHYVLRQLDEGNDTPNLGEIDGRLELAVKNDNGQMNYAPGDTLTFTLGGKGLVNIDAFSARLNFDSQKFEIVQYAIPAESTKKMENYSQYRKHSNGVENLYFVLSNMGNKPLLNGDMELLTFKLKVKEEGASSNPNLRTGHISDVSKKWQFELSQLLLVGQGLQQKALDPIKVLFSQPDSVDKTTLKQVLSINNVRQQNDYTAESWAKFAQQLDKANAVLRDDEATSEDVEQALIALRESVATLERLSGKPDRSALEKALLGVYTKKPTSGKTFTDASKKALDLAIEAVKASLGKPDAMQEEVDASAKNLINAIEQLQEQRIPVDKSGLLRLIEQAKDKKPEKDHSFTDDTQKLLDQSLEAAEAVYNDPQATDEDVKKSTDALGEAIKGLKLQSLPQGTESGGTPSGQGAGQTPGVSPGSGDKAPRDSHNQSSVDRQSSLRKQSSSTAKKKVTNSSKGQHGHVGKKENLARTGADMGLLGWGSLTALLALVATFVSHRRTLK